MATTACPTSDELRDFSLGLLQNSTSNRIEDHLARCGICLNRLSMLSSRDTIAALEGEGTRSGEEAIWDLNIAPVCTSIAEAKLTQLKPESEDNSRELPVLSGAAERGRPQGPGSVSPVPGARWESRPEAHRGRPRRRCGAKVGSRPRR